MYVLVCACIWVLNTVCCWNACVCGYHYVIVGLCACQYVVVGWFLSLDVCVWTVCPACVHAVCA